MSTTTDDTSSYSDLSTMPHIDLSNARRAQSVAINPLPSFSSETSGESGRTQRPATKRLNQEQLKQIEKLIGEEYETLKTNEASYSYFIEEAAVAKRAATILDQHPDGTFFVRRASDSEQEKFDAKYFLVFVSHKRVGQLPICADKNLRAFQFLSGYGHGSEVTRVYSGIDIMIQKKQENTFSELEYPFQICLHQPIDQQNIECSPLPDEVRAKSCLDTILHELVCKGLIPYFNELIRIAKDDVHALRDKARFLVKKINGRNKKGQTPLILAILGKNYHFIELLLDHGADVNITDIDGCSPLQHACRLADPRSLKKLLDRGADSHYVNPKKGNDTNVSNLSALHYLALAVGTSSRNIKRCAMHLEARGCPLMPLTSDSKSPFDLAHSSNNSAYECVKMLCNRRDFVNILPKEVASRNEAKTFLAALACPNLAGKCRLRLKQYDNTECLGNNGLFLFYKIKKRRNQMKDEFGLCIHHNGRISVYPITQQMTKKIAVDQSKTVVYTYSVISDTPRDKQHPVVLFRSCDELIYSHTKYQGILPILLKDYIKSDSRAITIMSALSLLIRNLDGSYILDDGDSDSEEEDTPGAQLPIDTDKIDSFNYSQIRSLKLLNGNHRRLIWFATAQHNSQTTFPLAIKDHAPSNELEAFKQYRFNEFHSRLGNQEFPFQFSSQAQHEYQHESELLLHELRHHRFIVHAFQCHQAPINGDLRIFMEYLSMGNLHTYLTRIRRQALEPLINAFHWIYQLAQVMAYLASKKIVHRDLAARNILLKTDKHIKLSDFGLSLHEGPLASEHDCRVSLRWSAPEYHRRRDTISSSADVWSFGIVLWEIFFMRSFALRKRRKRKRTTNKNRKCHWTDFYGNIF